MKKISIFAATISLAMLLNGCQNADDSDASEEEQGGKNTVAANDSNPNSTPEKGNEGGSSGSESATAGNSENSGSAQGAGGANYGAAVYAKSGSDTSGVKGDNYAKSGSDSSGAKRGKYADYGAANSAKSGSNSSGAKGGKYANANYGAANSANSGSDRPRAQGGYGAGSSGQGPGSAAPQFKEGSAEDAVLKVWTAINKGEQTGLAEVISSRAIGELADLRNGTLSKEKLNALKQQMARVKFLRPKTIGSSKTITIRNSAGRTFRFTCRKEDGKYLVRKLEYKAPSKKKRGR
jgi:hypothetical protein